MLSQSSTKSPCESLSSDEKMKDEFENQTNRSRLQFCEDCQGYLPLRSFKRHSPLSAVCWKCGRLNEARFPVKIVILPEPEKPVEFLSENARRVLEELKEATRKCMRK